MSISTLTEYEKSRFHQIMDEIDQFIPKHYIKAVEEVLLGDGVKKEHHRIKNARNRRVIDLEIAEALREIAKIPEDILVQDEKKNIISKLKLSQ